MSNAPQKAALRWDPSAVSTENKSKRSKLHISSTVDWLKKRHKNTANMQYLLLPNELHQHKEVRNIFEVFDEDNSGKLTLDEFYNMLRQAHIAIKMEDLQEFYSKVDDNRDEALDFTEFKNSTLSEQANFHFGRMMAKVRAEAEAQLQTRKKEKKEAKGAQKSKRVTEKTEESEKQDSERVYLPRTFGNLLNYLTYENKKHDLINFVKSDNNLGDKFKKFSQLLELQMDKDIYLERLSQRFQNRFNTRNTQSLSPTRIAQATTETNIKAETPKESPERLERPETKNLKDEEKPKVKPKFFEELDQIAKNARKEAKQEVTEELRRKDKQFSVLPTVSRKDVGSTNDITNTHKTTRKSLFLPQPALGKFVEDEGKDHEHMTSIMHHHQTHNDSTMENDQKGSSNFIPSTTNLRNSPQSQFFKTSVKFPRSVVHSKTATPKRPERKLAGIVGGSARSSSLITKAAVDSYEAGNSLDHQESIMLHQKIAALHQQQEQNTTGSQGSNRSKNLGSLTKIPPQNFVPSFSDFKNPKDNHHPQAASKIFETRISTLNESQAEISQFSSLPLLSPKGSFPLMKSQRDSIETGGHQQAQLSTFSKNNPRTSFTIKEESPSVQGTMSQDNILAPKVIRKGSKMPTDYTCVSPMYHNNNNIRTKPMLGDKPRAKTFLAKIIQGGEGLGRLSSPKSTTNQLAKARLLVSSQSQADIKRDPNQSEVKKVDLNFTVYANITAGDKEKPKGKRVYTTGKRSSLKPGIVNHAFEPMKSIAIESKYAIPSLNIDK